MRYVLKDSKWMDNSGNEVDLPSRLHELADGAPSIRTSIPTQEQEFYTAATGKHITNYNQLEDMGLSLETNSNKVIKTKTAKPTKKELAVKIEENTKKIENIIKISPEKAKLLKEGFKLVENEDGSIDFVPEQKVEEVEEPEVEDVIDGQTFDQPVVTFQELQQRAMERAQEKYTARKAKQQ
jgi:hypothetical protein